MVKITTQEIPHKNRNKRMQNIGVTTSLGSSSSSSSAAITDDGINWIKKISPLIVKDENGNIKVDTNLYTTGGLSAFGSNPGNIIIGDNPDKTDNKIALAALNTDDIDWIRFLMEELYYSIYNNSIHIKKPVIFYEGVSSFSDARLKTNVKTLNNRGYLRPVTYYKDGKVNIGFIAQEVKRLYPELVVDGEYLSLNYPQLTAVLQAQIIELNKRIEVLENKLKEK